MKKFLTTLFILLSAGAMAVLCILPKSRELPLLSMIAAGAHVADRLFHEMGHSIFNWLFGRPAIPWTFTLFADDTELPTLVWGKRSWIVQTVAFAVLGFVCYNLKRLQSPFFIYAVLLSLAVLCFALTPYYCVIILYMGYGGAIAAGGCFLYRGLRYIDPRKRLKRWLNAFLGLILILNNLYFSYALAFDAESMGDSNAQTALGMGDNDFQAIADRMHWNVKGIAVFTIIYCCIVIIGCFLLAAFQRGPTDIDVQYDEFE